MYDLIQLTRLNEHSSDRTKKNTSVMVAVSNIAYFEERLADNTGAPIKVSATHVRLTCGTILAVTETVAQISKQIEQIRDRNRTERVL